MKRKIIENRAGLIPYILLKDKIVNRSSIRMLFMKPSNSRYGGNTFQISKGKIDEGETEIEAAIRESVEELGLKKNFIIAPWKVGNYHIIGRDFEYDMAIYACRYKNQSQLIQPVFETSARKWMSEKEFLESGRKVHKEIIQKTCDIIFDSLNTSIT